MRDYFAHFFMKLDLLNRRFGRLNVIGLDPVRTKAGKLKWICRCDCSKIIIVIGSGLVNGNTKSCGCWRKPAKPLVGIRFSRWTVKSLSEVRTNKGKLKWLCRCECGTERNVLEDSLIYGVTKSCGCLRADVSSKNHRTHGESGKTSEYCSWSSMLNRCNNPRNKNYSYYGGRGIKVCKRWSNNKNGFNNFIKDMGRKPSSSHSLDRFPNKNGDYKPSNCRWATKMEQSSNLRSNRWITFNGRKMILASWARELGTSSDNLRGHLKRHSMKWVFAFFNHV